MKLTTMQNPLSVRLDNETIQNLDILHQATQVDKSKIIRMILKEFFERNDDLIDKYYKSLRSED